MDTLLLALPLVIAIAFGLGALNELWIESRLRTNGLTTKGQVLELRSDSRFGLNYSLVEYSYRIAAEIYTSRQAISAAHYAALQANNPVTVSYLPERPATARLAGTDLDSANRQSLVIRALILLAVWIILLIAVPR